MANQPPARPWFRVPMLGRRAPPPPPAPSAPPQRAPAPQPPRPPFVRPALAQAFRPTQPQPSPPQPPLPSTTTRSRVAPPSPPTIITQPPTPPSPPNVVSSPTSAMISPKNSSTRSSPRKSPMMSSASPRKPQVSEDLPPPSSIISPASTFPPKSSSYPAISFAHSPTPTASPRAIEPLAKSSPSKKYIRSPPPITLPPQSKPIKEEPEAEPKNVLFHATFNKQATNNTSTNYGSVKEADRRAFLSDPEDARNFKILTIAGENKGATMELGFPSRRNRGYGGNGNDNVGKEARGGSGHEGKMTTSHPPKNAYVNSNIQVINNSIMLNCSLTQHDPGVHFSLLRNPIKGNGDGNCLKDHAN